MLYGLKSVKKFITASKDLSFRRESNIESDDYSWLKAWWVCYVVPQQHHAVGGKNSFVMSSFWDSFVCNKSTQHACYIWVYYHRNVIDTCTLLQRANRMFLWWKYFTIFHLYFICILCKPTSFQTYLFHGMFIFQFLWAPKPFIMYLFL